MARDTLEALERAGPSRRAVLKGLLVGLGAGVLVQANGGVTGFAQEKGTDGKRRPDPNDQKKLEKSKIEHKMEHKTEHKKEQKGGSEKKKK